jgi:hypothetical protein
MSRAPSGKCASATMLIQLQTSVPKWRQSINRVDMVLEIFSGAP